MKKFAVIFILAVLAFNMSVFADTAVIDSDSLVKAINQKVAILNSKATASSRQVRVLKREIKDLQEKLAANEAAEKNKPKASIEKVVVPEKQFGFKEIALSFAFLLAIAVMITFAIIYLRMQKKAKEEIKKPVLDLSAIREERMIDNVFSIVEKKEYWSVDFSAIKSYQLNGSGDIVKEVEKILGDIINAPDSSKEDLKYCPYCDSKESIKRKNFARHFADRCDLHLTKHSEKIYMDCYREQKMASKQVA